MTKMTWPQLQEKLYEIDLQERAIKRNREALWDKYIAGLPYKVGDKVRVERGAVVRENIVCFIAKIRPGYRQPEIQFNKVKPDGTMSGQSAGIHYYDAIWVIEPATEAEVSSDV